MREASCGTFTKRNLPQCRSAPCFYRKPLRLSRAAPHPTPGQPWKPDQARWPPPASSAPNSTPRRRGSPLCAAAHRPPPPPGPLLRPFPVSAASTPSAPRRISCLLRCPSSPTAHHQHHLALLLLVSPVSYPCLPVTIVQYKLLCFSVAARCTHAR